MIKEKKIKAQSRKILSQGNWSSIIISLSITAIFLFAAFSLLYLLLLSFDTVNTSNGEINSSKKLIAEIITFAFYIIVILISPIFNGFIKTCYNVSKGEKAFVGDTLYYFSNVKVYVKALRVNLFIIALLMIFSIVAFIIPFLFDNLLSNFLTTLLKTSTFSDIFDIVSVILWIAGGFLFFILSLKLVFAPFLFIENENMPTSFYITHSLAMSKKNFKNIFKLVLSFIPWLALCFFIFPIIYVGPYLAISVSTSVKWIIILEKEKNTLLC